MEDQHFIVLRVKNDSCKIFIKIFVFVIICSGVTTKFPLHSHSHAAAMDPKILDITEDLVLTIDSVA